MTPRELNFKIQQMDDLVKSRLAALENTVFENLYQVGLLQGELRALRTIRELVLSREQEEED